MLWFLLGIALASPDLASDMTTRLSVRHDPPACETLAALGPDDAVREALVEVAETVRLPPWAPMRAAACLVERADQDPEALAVARRWVVDPERPGLALVVLGGLDPLPPEEALALARRGADRAAEEPRLAPYVVDALRGSRHEAVLRVGRDLEAARP